MKQIPTAKGRVDIGKNIPLFIFLVINVALWVFFGYYIVVNTMLKDKALARLANVNIAGSSSVLFASSNNSNMQPQINVSLNGVNKYINPQHVGFKLDTSKAISYGKGIDIVAVWAAALDNIQDPVSIAPEISLNPQLLLEEFGISLAKSPSDGVRWQGNLLLGCETGKYFWQIDNEALTQELNLDIGKELLDLDLAKFIKADRAKQQFEICNKYVSHVSERLSTINSVLGAQELIKTDLALDVNQNWQIVDIDLIAQKIKRLADDTIQPAKLGDYREQNGAIWLLSAYTPGKKIDSAATLTKIQDWLVAKTNDLQLAYTDIAPEILMNGKPVYDFSNVVASGKTRIDIIRNGYANSSLKFAQYGIEALEDVIIPAKSRFSYIDTIKPQPRGRMANGSPISGGICNATTTIYRAALEAGFEITERTPHGFYVKSYEWGYNMNIVDAAYYTNPKLDLAFINDYDYPVLLDVDISRVGDGWQYHTVTIRTAQAAPKRKVAMVDWKKYNIHSPTIFTGEFTRVVTAANGSEMRRDKFVSRYYR